MKLRIVIVSLFAIFLSIILVGSIKEIGRDIKYPANTIMFVTDYTGKDKVKTLDKLHQVAREENIIIYKAFITKNCQTKTAIIGKQGRYVDALKSMPLTGVYYIKKNTSNKRFEQTLKDEMLKFTMNPINLKLAPTITFVSGIRAPSFWTLFFVFFITIYAVEMLLIKSSMVYRSFGRLIAYLLANLKCYLLTLFTLNTLIYSLFCLGNGGFDHVYSQMFGLMLLVMSIILLGLIGLANVLFTVLVKLTDIAGILKNRYINRVGSLIYLISILVSIVIFTLSVNTVLQSVTELKSYQKELANWQVLKNYVKPNFNDSDQEHTNADHMIDQDWLMSRTKRELTYLQNFNDEQGLIYLSPSEFDKENEIAYQTNIENPLTTDSRFSKQTKYVSSAFIKLNQTLYPKNDYGHKSKRTLLTFYVPKQFEKDIKCIQNNVLAETFAYTEVKPEQVQVLIIPDGQKLFLFNQAIPFGKRLPKQVAYDQILVEIDQNLIDIDSNLLALGGDVIWRPYENSLVKNTVLLPNLKKIKNESQLMSVDNVSQNAAVLAKNIASQIQGALLVLLGVMISSGFILWEYLKNQYQRQAKMLVVTYLFSGHQGKLQLLILAPLVLGVVSIGLFSGLLIQDMGLGILILSVYLLEILVIVCLNQSVLKAKRLNVIKDALE